jgi:cation transport regulator ChaB
VRRFEAEFLAFMENSHRDVLQTIHDKKELPNELKQQLDSLTKEFKQRFMSAKAPKKKPSENKTPGDKNASEEREVPAAKA